MTDAYRFPTRRRQRYTTSAAALQPTSASVDGSGVGVGKVSAKMFPGCFVAPGKLGPKQSAAAEC